MSAIATRLPESCRIRSPSFIAVQRSNVRKTRFPPRLCDKQVISNNSLSIVSERRFQPRLAAIVGFASPKERSSHSHNFVAMTPFWRNLLRMVSKTQDFAN
jgi:hypothetical protein